MPIEVIVVPHNEKWHELFVAEADLVANALGTNVAAVHHIGSTAVPEIYAKPILDLLVEVRDLAAVDDADAAMERLGYFARGEFGIPGRRFFFKDDERRVRTHHVHAFIAGSPAAIRHLAFRDFLRTHDEIAALYSELKRRLAAECGGDIERYMDGKDPFIKRYESEAVLWFAQQKALSQ